MIEPEILVLLGTAGAIFAIGLACLISRPNLIKIVIGLEFLGSSVSLVIITGGYLAGDVAVSQAVIFTLITIEAIIAGVALALVIVAKRTWKTLDIGLITRHLQERDR
jgi:multisubunit Na+/H+ antiporter MnhC subunit